MPPCQTPRLFVPLALGLSIAVALSGPARASGLQCAPRDAVLQMIGQQGHQRHALGLSGQAVMELYAHPESGGWMITAALPDGRMCLIAAGSDFSAETGTVPPAGTRS